MSESLKSRGLGVRFAVYGSLLVAAMSVDYGVGEIADHTYGADRAVAYAEQNGYTGVTLDGVEHLAVEFRGCSDSDEVGYELEGTAPNGVHAHILVCKGIFKGATLRQG